jgi:protease-4
LVTLGADRVLAAPGTITGSIGVFATTFATRRFFRDFLGVTFGVYATDPDAVVVSFLDPPSKRERAAVDQDLDRIYADFVDKTAKARNKSVAEIQAAAQGRVWSGTAALAHGLVDELGGMEVALARLKELAGIAAESDVKLLELPAVAGPLAVLQELVGDSSSLARGRIESSELRSLLTAAQRLSRAPGESTLALPPGFAVRF